MKILRDFIITVILLFVLVGEKAFSDDVKAIFVGQWIWCEKDKMIYEEVISDMPSLLPGIWVSTMGFSNGQVTQQVALPPYYLGENRRIALVVRFDDQFNKIWAGYDLEIVIKQLNKKLDWLINNTGLEQGKIAEIQLDYDCPVRKLYQWSKIVKGLTISGALKNQNVWLTSLPSHMKEKNYGDWFRDIVKGHILQVFDTGFPVAKASILSEYTKKQEMNFRIGIGVFERKLKSGQTEHHVWFNHIGLFSADPHFKGVWIFPGGIPYRNIFPGGNV